MTVSLETDPKSVIVVSNPNSTNAHRTELVLNQLRNLHDFNIHRVDISKEPEDMVGGIDELIDKETASSLVVSGGDGTMHFVANSLLAHARHEVPPIFVLGSGRQNDFANLLHGDSHDLAKTISDGELLDLSPMAVNLEPADGPITEENAWLYANFGAGASSAGYLDSEKVRQRHLKHFTKINDTVDALGVIRTILREHPFVAKVGETEAQELIDYSFMLSKHMANIVHEGGIEFGKDAKVIEFDSYNRRKQIVRLIAGRLGVVVTGDSIPDLHIAQAPHTGIGWSLDGEVKPSRLQTGDTVRFHRSPKSLRFYTKPS